MNEKLRLTIAYDEPDEEGSIVVIDALRLMPSPDEDEASVAPGGSEPLELILAE